MPRLLGTAWQEKGEQDRPGTPWQDHWEPLSTRAVWGPSETARKGPRRSSRGSCSGEKRGIRIVEGPGRHRMGRGGMRRGKWGWACCGRCGSGDRDPSIAIYSSISQIRHSAVLQMGMRGGKWGGGMLREVRAQRVHQTSSGGRQDVMWGIAAPTISSGDAMSCRGERGGGGGGERAMVHSEGRNAAAIGTFQRLVQCGVFRGGGSSSRDLTGPAVVVRHAVSRPLDQVGPARPPACSGTPWTSRRCAVHVQARTRPH